MKVNWSIKDAFASLKVIKSVLSERLRDEYQLSDRDVHRVCVRLMNLIVNLGKKPEVEVIEEVWSAIKEADGLMQTLDEDWLATVSGVDLLRDSITFVKSAWSPDLTGRR